MEKIIKSFILISVIFTIICCSKDEENKQNIFNRDINKKSERLISPNGFLVAESINQLEEELFKKDPNIIIKSVIFFDIKNVDSAVAYINFVDNGFDKKMGFVIGNVLAEYDSDKDLLTTSNVNLLKSNYITFNCSGTTCCTATEHINYDTKVVSFFCKCDGNSGGNNGCSMTVESSTNGKQPSTLQPMPK